MDTGGFDTYPILHNNRIYNVITRMELTFREVRAMLDWLIAEGAFPAEGGEREPEGLYSCPVEGLLFDVDVQGYEVVVYRRKALDDAGTTGRKGVATAGELLAFLARETRRRVCSSSTGIPSNCSSQPFSRRSAPTSG
jgi:hypothetical protein